MKRETALLADRRGSVLIATVVITTALALILAGTLRHSLTERRLNSRHELRLESRNAAEAIAEYGFAQLRHKFETQTSLGPHVLDPNSAGALKLPSEGFLGPQVQHDSLELIGGTVPPFPNSLTYVDPNDPDNEFDPLKGKMVRSREIQIYAQATVDDLGEGPSVTTYVTQSLQVRDAPLFAHAIFYNLDLEISPGPHMEVYGPVHTNGNLYVQGINGLQFHDQVTTAGHLYHGWGTTNPRAQGTGHESLQGGHVRFVDRAGNLTSMKVTGKHMDSTMNSASLSPDWRSFASNRWHGNLQTADHGIENYKPVAFPDYQPDDPATPAYDPMNSGHALIEPALPQAAPSYNAEIESQKMANKAGIRLVWDAATSSVAAFRKDGQPLDISALEGAGSDKLWQHGSNAMYDHRRGAHIDLVEINVGKLKQLVEYPDYSESGKYIPDFDPTSDWNGIVYVETTSSSPDPNVSDRLNHSGVRLWGGDTDEPGQGIPSRGSDEGMTFATNNALYVKGNFNADGALHQSHSSMHSAIKPELGEKPVALFGDSVTILSNSWDDNDTGSKPRASATEVAAAIVSGLIPSDAHGNDASSGGVHNFPRLLENWSGRDLFIRGSLVALYESEHDNSPWSIDYYSPPKRKWGFSELYKNGTYPPGTPLIRTYRRIDYRNMSEAEYQSAKSSLPW